MLWGCPDNLTAVDTGAPVGGQEVIPDMDEGVFSGACIVDEDCQRDAYCQVDEESGVGQCEEGCRLSPNDSCVRPGSRKICDETSRQCVLSCEDDNGCYEDEYCANGVCATGCRITDEGESNCPDTDVGPQFCDQESRTCSQGGVCCDLDDLCFISPQRSCEQVGGEILLGVFSCEPDPCRALCSRDTQCSPSEYCADFGRCSPGCRQEDPNGCPPDLTCHPEQSQCVNFICDLDEECPDWQFCAFEGRCRDGCREGMCPEGFNCAEDRVCRQTCELDESCPDRQYCEASTGRCRVSCDPITHQGCGSDEACVEGRCLFGCADDPQELLGDDEADVAPSVEWTIGEEGGVRASGLLTRTLCIGDEDWTKVTLNAGERLEIYLQSRPSVGPISLSVISPEGEVLKMSDPWAADQTLRYPDNAVASV